MKSVLLIKKICLLLFVVMVVIACRKTDNFNYKDALMGNGEGVPAITVDTNVKNVDVSKYAQARVFPGLVGNTEPRLNNLTLSMNLNYNLVTDNLRINVPPQPQFSTGLYAAPGELVIIDLPAGDYSLSVQIGAWTDDLSNIQNAPRDPILYSRTQLAPGRNYIRNLYGGHVYIFSATPITTPINLVFSNVVKSPDFILGQTTDAQWQEAIKNSSVPWLELRSANMIFVVPREYCITHPIKEPTKAMQMWDDIINYDYYEWEGLKVNPVDEVDKAPLLPWRCVLDIKPSAGYGHSGFPVVAQNDLSWYGGIGNVVNIDGGGNWGYFHEVGHNNQQPRYWSWSTLGETTNNLFSFKVAKRLSSGPNGVPSAWPPAHPALVTDIPRALAFAKEIDPAKNFDGADVRISTPFARLTPFVQIFDKVPTGMSYDGWGFMAELYKKARRAPRISLTDQDKHDFVYETLCDYTGKDWIYFFQAWGIKISNISKDKMAAKYPFPNIMNQRIWEYNPLTRTGGDGSFSVDPYDRANWTVTANTSHPSEGNVSYIIDNDIASYWHSDYNLSSYSGPHIVKFDFSKNISINGFSLVQRNGNGRFKHVKVEYSSNNTNWTEVGGSPFDVANTGQARQGFKFPAFISCRYLRLTINLNDQYVGAPHATLADFNVIHDENDRLLWKVTPSSEKVSDGGGAIAVLDGILGSFWSTMWGPDAPPPHTLTVDMGKLQDINGFVFTQRQGGGNGNVKNLYVYTSQDNITYTPVNGGNPFSLQKINTAQTFSISNTNCRYFKLEIRAASDTWANNIYGGMAEVNVTHP